jgi:hypothetical protein
VLTPYSYLLLIFIEDLEVEVEISELGTFIVKFADDTKALQEIQGIEGGEKM